MSVRVLLVGSGGREHALAWKLAQSDLVQFVTVVPGNGGTDVLSPKIRNNSSIKQDEFRDLLEFAIAERVTLVVPGPEAPLVDGIADYFKQHGPASISVFGPSKAAAQMEGSKAFSKDFMKRHQIPTASYNTFKDHGAAKAFLQDNKSTKFVIKASGLAAGKGVIIPQSHEEGVAALASIMLDKEFGQAGDEVVIEEFLEGEEISILSFSDGHSIVSLPPAQDHKRVGDGDTGPNTGGMGCYAPAAVATTEILAQIQSRVLQPTIDGMRSERFPFVGCLFTGLMLTPSGPKVLEYNVRFGDPETQTVLPLLESDLAEIMLACTSGYLSAVSIKVATAFAATVVVAAGGYPGTYAKGTAMQVSPPVNANALHFHAGTAINPAGQLVTAGGRVIASTAIASSLATAVEQAYSTVSLIQFQDMHYRKDIAWRELQRSKQIPAADQPLTYANAGVSISDGNELVRRIKTYLRRTRRPGCDAEIGGFGGAIALSAPTTGYPSDSPTIIAAIDGVGTKLLIAREMAKFDTVGIDLVAMNVNDLVVQGAEPLAFLDYYACGKLELDAAAAFVKGVAEGCVQAGCALIGGETAEMPGLYSKGDFDAAGCAIGALKVGQTVLPDVAGMIQGDVLLGLGSSGVHSNGFSLVRKILERANLKFSDSAPWQTNTSVGLSLLEPTKVYVKSLLAAVTQSEKGAVKGMAHITGGGLIENIPRMLPPQLAARLQVGSWPIPPVLTWLKKAGGLETREFATTFNTGLGMVIVVEAGAAAAVCALLQSAGENVHTVGDLIARDSNAEGCLLEGKDVW